MMLWVFIKSIIYVGVGDCYLMIVKLQWFGVFNDDKFQIKEINFGGI